MVSKANHASEQSKRFKGAEFGGLRAEVRGCADQQHSERPEHQDAEVGSDVEEIRLYRPPTRR
jgi:hypothetical protein